MLGRRSVRSQDRLRANMTSSIVAFIVGCLAVSTVNAYSPESPEVREMVIKAAKGLAASTYGGDQSHGTQLGGKCLIALAMLKSGEYDLSHAKMAEAIEACRQTVKDLPKILETDKGIYSLGVAIVFLCEMDAKLYRKEIERMLEALTTAQKPQAAWGYSWAPLCDTSMSQYAVLAIWTAARKGFKVNMESVRKATSWFLRTQDPRGIWGYQAQDPGPGNFKLIEQTVVNPLSLTSAGLGCVYILADLLGVIKIEDVALPENDLPPVLVEVFEDEGAESGRQEQPKEGVQDQPRSVGVPVQAIEQAVVRGNQWLSANFKANSGNQWVFYYLYALERCYSFRELALGKLEKEPAWYNAGVEFMQQKQLGDGSFAGGSLETAPQPNPLDTAFAVLFLTRSTRQSIHTGTLGDGILRGGQGLPSDASQLELTEDGRLEKRKLKGPASEMLEIIDKLGELDMASQSIHSIEMTLSREPKKRAQQMARLRRLVISGPTYEARLIAVKTLSRERDLIQVPTLIFALTDPDFRVKLAASEGLRFMSRKFAGYGMAERPSNQRLEEIIENWKEWYLTIRPDGEFLN